MGAGSYAGQRQSGFLGCLGETRLVDRPLDSSEWLISRVAGEPSAEPTPTAEPSVTATPTTGQTVKPGQTSDFFKATAPYTQAGLHKNLNGRDWNTVCEPYSQTERCRTDIWATTAWTSPTGQRQWRTERATAATGRNGCRSYAMATVYQATARAGGGFTFSQDSKWVLNNIVMFK